MVNMMMAMVVVVWIVGSEVEMEVVERNSCWTMGTRFFCDSGSFELGVIWLG